MYLCVHYTDHWKQWRKDGQAVSNWIGWLTPLVGVAVFYGAYRGWMRGMDRYQGARE